MDKHTFIGKRKIGSTDICDFTDYQGIGRDPLYKRYESVNSVVKRFISPEYAHFLAVPDYMAGEDMINWYIDEWEETPERFVDLDDSKRAVYDRVRRETIEHFRNVAGSLSGESLQIMTAALRYIDDDFIYCCDGKVYLLAWGMTPDTRKHISRSELVRESPLIRKYKITFEAGGHGKISKLAKHISLEEGMVFPSDIIPVPEVEEGYEFKGWTPSPDGYVVDSDIVFNAVYEKCKETDEVDDPEVSAVGAVLIHLIYRAKCHDINQNLLGGRRNVHTKRRSKRRITENRTDRRDA